MIQPKLLCDSMIAACSIHEEAPKEHPLIPQSILTCLRGQLVPSASGTGILSGPPSPREQGMEKNVYPCANLCPSHITPLLQPQGWPFPSPTSPLPPGPGAAPSPCRSWQ